MRLSQRPSRPFRAAVLAGLAVSVLAATVLAAGTAVSLPADGEPSVETPTETPKKTRGEKQDETSAEAATDEAGPTLTPEHVQWLEDVQFLITPEEREIFEALPRSYQRNTFIERFWRERDPFEDTNRNELRERWIDDLIEVRLRYGDLWEEDHRARI